VVLSTDFWEHPTISNNAINNNLFIFNPLFEAEAFHKENYK